MSYAGAAPDIGPFEYTTGSAACNCDFDVDGDVDGDDLRIHVSTATGVGVDEFAAALGTADCP